MTAKRPTESQKVAAERINTMSTDAKGCEPSVVPSDTFVPIFVLSRDRVTSLQQVLQSYNRTLSSPYEIITLDHLSTYPPMLEYLRELSSSGVRVHALKSPLWKDAVKESGFVIQDYLAAHPHAAFYVFTDSDIALVRSSPDILLFFAGLLRSCKELNVVGPDLQFSDIPDRYADWEKVLLTHGKSFGAMFQTWPRGMVSGIMSLGIPLTPRLQFKDVTCFSIVNKIHASVLLPHMLRSMWTGTTTQASCRMTKSGT